MRLEDADILKQQRYIKQNLIPLLSKEYHLESQIKKQFKAARSSEYIFASLIQYTSWCRIYKLKNVIEILYLIIKKKS